MNEGLLDTAVILEMCFFLTCAKKQRLMLGCQVNISSLLCIIIIITIILILLMIIIIIMTTTKTAATTTTIIIFIYTDQTLLQWYVCISVFKHLNTYFLFL